MTLRLHVSQIDEQISHEVFERNILNSRKIIMGDFESALEDMIYQLEQPPIVGGRFLPAADMTKRISRALRQGLAGLPPNGFDFCTWLWDVAPLHFVQIPQANEIGTSFGFQYGVLHLRRIAVMTANVFVEEQPQKVSVLVPLIDSSVGWVDARDLIAYGLLEYYVQHFEEEYPNLLTFATGKKALRRLIPLGVCAQAVVLDPSQSVVALQIASHAFEAIADTNVSAGISYLLRVIAMYGDHTSLAAFIVSQREQSHPRIQRVLCDCVRISRTGWDESFRATVLPILKEWSETGSSQNKDCLEKTLTRFQQA